MSTRVAVNDIADAEALAHLLTLDSVYGRFAHPVRAALHVEAGARKVILSAPERVLAPYGVAIVQRLLSGADSATTVASAVCSVMDNESAEEQRRLLAAVAAALLGSQGSPVWSRTAELLLLSSHEIKRHHKRAASELSRALGDDFTRP